SDLFNGRPECAALIFIPTLVKRIFPKNLTTGCLSDFSAKFSTTRAGKKVPYPGGPGGRSIQQAADPGNPTSGCNHQIWSVLKIGRGTPVYSSLKDRRMITS